MKIGLVLEGGGTRGVFSAGVLDYFMEINLYFPYVIGVSAGSGVGASYVSRQPKRIKNSMIDSLRETKYVSLKNYFKTGDLFDMDMIYDYFPRELYPFDFNTFFSSEQKCITVATNCENGQAVYLEEKEDKERFMRFCRASSSMPLVSKIVHIDGIPLLDGSVSDSIPIQRAIKDGCEKNVIILTQNKGYLKKSDKPFNLVAKFFYRQYPKFYQALVSRAYEYNRILTYIEQLEVEGKVFVLRPEVKVVKRTENDPDVLTEFYQHGFNVAQRNYPALEKYLED